MSPSPKLPQVSGGEPSEPGSDDDDGHDDSGDDDDDDGQYPPGGLEQCDVSVFLRGPTLHDFRFFVFCILGRAGGGGGGGGAGGTQVCTTSEWFINRLALKDV